MIRILVSTALTLAALLITFSMLRFPYKLFKLQALTYADIVMSVVLIIYMASALAVMWHMFGVI